MLRNDAPPSRANLSTTISGGIAPITVDPLDASSRNMALNPASASCLVPLCFFSFFSSSSESSFDSASSSELDEPASFRAGLESPIRVSGANSISEKARGLVTRMGGGAGGTTGVREYEVVEAVEAVDEEKGTKGRVLMAVWGSTE